MLILYKVLMKTVTDPLIKIIKNKSSNPELE